MEPPDTLGGPGDFEVPIWVRWDHREVDSPPLLRPRMQFTLPEAHIGLSKHDSCPVANWDPFNFHSNGGRSEVGLIWGRQHNKRSTAYHITFTIGTVWMLTPLINAMEWTDQRLVRQSRFQGFEGGVARSCSRGIWDRDIWCASE